MPRNGSGQYNPLTNTWNPPVTGVLATGADFQAQLNDISAAITQSVSKDGQTPMTANLPMGNNSIVGIASGTETSPSISANGDANTGLYFPAADTVAIATGGVKRVEVDASGNVGLGVTPSAFSAGYIGFQLGGNPVIASQNNLSLAGNAYYNAGWKYITSNYASRYDSNFNNGGIHAWFTAPSGTAGNAISFTQAMTLDASGRLLVGLTSGPTTVTVATPSTNSNLGVYSNSQITLSNPTTVGAYSQIAFGYNSGTSISNAAAAIGFISTSADTWGKGDLVFATRSVTTDTAPTERARIDSSGNFGIGTSSPGGRLQVSGGRTLLSSTTGDSYILKLQNPSFTNGCFLGSPGENMFAVSAADGSERARIDSDGNLLVGYTTSNGAYKLQVNSQIFATSSTIATSDGRYKENIKPINGALDMVKAFNPVQFSWKKHPVHAFNRETPTVGFIAQELEQVLVGKPFYKSIIKRNECIITPAEYETIEVTPAKEEIKDEDGNVLVAAQPAITEQRLVKPAVTEEFLGIAECNLLPILTKAIQEQQALIESLTARITALEAK